jgi:type I restriction enzyme M protein
LNIPRYIDSSEPEDLHDLDAHLRGGIPNRDLDALEKYWEVFASIRQELFESADRPGYSQARVASQVVKTTILKHPEFVAYSGRVAAVFDQWRAAHEPALKKLKERAKAKEVIAALGEDLLARFASLPLLDKYDVYQRLMDYWAETMQDDVFLIGTDDWIDPAKPRAAIDNKERKIKETPDLVVARKRYKMDLIPPALIVARYFASEQGEVDALEAKREEAERALEEFVEENSGEEGLLEDAKTEAGSVTEASVLKRLDEIAEQPAIDDEGVALTRCLELIEVEAGAAKDVREAQSALDLEVLSKYGKLTEAEIKTLVVEDKWMASISTAVDAEIQRLTEALAARLRELEERYAETLQDLEGDVKTLSAKVEQHLYAMGFAS